MKPLVKDRPATPGPATPAARTHVPLPPGNAPETLAKPPALPVRPEIQALRESIQHALDHREEALAYAMQFARDLDAQLANRFVSMYVNERTLNYGEDGKEAIRKLLELGHERGIIPHAVKVDFVG